MLGRSMYIIFPRIYVWYVIFFALATAHWVNSMDIGGGFLPGGIWQGHGYGDDKLRRTNT